MIDTFLLYGERVATIIMAIFVTKMAWNDLPHIYTEQKAQGERIANLEGRLIDKQGGK